MYEYFFDDDRSPKLDDRHLGDDPGYTHHDDGSTADDSRAA